MAILPPCVIRAPSSRFGAADSTVDLIEKVALGNPQSEGVHPPLESEILQAPDSSFLDYGIGFKRVFKAGC
jgi:hypothetical protein